MTVAVLRAEVAVFRLGSTAVRGVVLEEVPERKLQAVHLVTPLTVLPPMLALSGKEDLGVVTLAVEEVEATTVVYTCEYFFVETNLVFRFSFWDFAVQM